MKKYTKPTHMVIFTVIFYFCAFYFLLMGAGLIFFPNLLIQGFTENNIPPPIIGMLRGAGGATIPYAALYIMIAHDPFKRMWALSMIFIANVVAIILDFASVLVGEYKLSYAMLDVPVELLSIAGILIIWLKARKSL